MRNRLALLLLPLVLLATGAVSRMYDVEYKYPTPEIGTLDVTLHVDTPPKQAESLLRREMLAAADFKKPTADVMLTAWNGWSHAKGDEEIIKLQDGSEHLMYLAKGARIMPYSAYQKMQKH